MNKKFLFFYEVENLEITIKKSWESYKKIRLLKKFKFIINESKYNF